MRCPGLNSVAMMPPECCDGKEKSVARLPEKRRESSGAEAPAPLKRRDLSARLKPCPPRGRCAIIGYIFFTTSPTLAEPVPLNVAVAESSSTSVTVAIPILSVTALITFPVAGSFTTRTWRLTSSLSPTFTPTFLPTVTMMVLPVTSATTPLTVRFKISTLDEAAFNCLAVSSTAPRTASPRMVLAKLLLPMSRPPPPPPDHPPPAPSSEVLPREDSPFPETPAIISAEDIFSKPITASADVGVLIIPAELGDRTDDDRIHAEHRADFCRGIGIRAV